MPQTSNHERIVCMRGLEPITRQVTPAELGIELDPNAQFQAEGWAVLRRESSQLSLDDYVTIHEMYPSTPEGEESARARSVNLNETDGVTEYDPAGGEDVIDRQVSFTAQYIALKAARAVVMLRAEYVVQNPEGVEAT